MSYRTAIVGLSWIGADPAGEASDPVLGTATPYSHASAMAPIPEIDVVGRAQLLERADRPAAEPPGIGVAPLLVRIAADGEDRFAHVAQPQGVELPDEAAAQHPDPHGCHQ